ncbi:phage virion morphogenesis (putative tail completion) protein [Tistlia consotensis]|uniref:Phage virion morphogenesis (Putative tail completion) protein n=1 Tax=Tistlia consotensis USBA 355 TaxID=560819 RepID=A0A1Y6CRL5_9PROT|nr:phage virion morphogenesis protein [Tistlia consotensis]SMF83056.1 phage virion morphogenesis (putative tail completion) protein [Tistlia consotensis USBA 355]SNS31905.1 phage virion morphogenesis (putative tail completion) protein [Tistlia consotensis]
MAGAQVSLSIDDQAVREAFVALLSRADDLTPVMEEVGAALVASTQLRFERGQAPGGSPWPPSLRVLHRGGNTLVESGRLRDSITYEASPTGVRVGTNVVYGAIHQFGGTIRKYAQSRAIYRRYNETTGELSNRFVKRRRSNFLSYHEVGEHEVKIPARPYLGIDEADQAEILATLQDWIGGAAPGAVE